MSREDGVSPRRRRDYAAEYRRRKRRAAEQSSTFYEERRAKGERRGLSRVQAVGHARDAGERAPGRFFSQRRSTVTGFFEPGNAASIKVSRREMQRVVAHHHLIDRLERGEITPTEFRRRVSRWRPLKGRRFVSDPALALAMRLSVPLDDRDFVSARMPGQRGRRS
jgi:hypothetical protein